MHFEEPSSVSTKLIQLPPHIIIEHVTCFHSFLPNALGTGQFVLNSTGLEWTDTSPHTDQSTTNHISEIHIFYSEFSVHGMQNDEESSHSSLLFVQRTHTKDPTHPTLFWFSLPPEKRLYHVVSSALQLLDCSTSQLYVYF